MNSNNLLNISKLQKKELILNGEILAIALMKFSQKKDLKNQLISVSMMPEPNPSMVNRIQQVKIGKMFIICKRNLNP